MIRHAILLLMIIGAGLSSCRDALPGPCDCDGQPSGKKCREVRYEQDDYIGFIDFRYNEEGRLHEQAWNPVAGTPKVSTYEYGANGKAIHERISYPGREGEAQWDFEYNEADSLLKASYYENGQLKRVIQYEYTQANLLISKSFAEGGLITSRLHYTYDANNRLWRLAETDRDHRLLREEYYTYYGNFTERVEMFDSNSVYLGYRFIQRLADQRLLEVRAYDAEDGLLEYTLYEYHQGVLNRSATYSGDGAVIQRSDFLYY